MFHESLIRFEMNLAELRIYNLQIHDRSGCMWQVTCRTGALWVMQYLFTACNGTAAQVTAGLWVDHGGDVFFSHQICEKLLTALGFLPVWHTHKQTHAQQINDLSPLRTKISSGPLRSDQITHSDSFNMIKFSPVDWYRTGRDVHYFKMSCQYLNHPKICSTQTDMWHVTSPHWAPSVSPHCNKYEPPEQHSSRKPVCETEIKSSTSHVTQDDHHTNNIWHKTWSKWQDLQKIIT